MENNIRTYNRDKSNMWVALIFGGSHVLMLLSYIHQWGTKPLNALGFIIISIFWIFIYIFLGWRKVMICDKFVIFKQYLPRYNKIEIVQIKDVSVLNVSILNVLYWNMGMFGNMYGDINTYMNMKFPEKYSFDFVKQTLIIKLKSGKTYQIAIKDAERIKNEIERQMITTNNKPQ